MTSRIHDHSKKSKLLLAAAFAAVAVSLASCGTTDHKLKTASIPKFSKPISEMNATELASASDAVGAAYAKDPSNRDAGLNYADLLRMTGKSDQALAVMQQVVIHHPDDQQVLAAFGKAQAAAGDLQAALNTIRRAQTPDRPDWKLTSAEGAILDQLGRPDEARLKYREALDLAPNEPSVLSNMGMSYLLTKDLRTAETYLKKAVAQPNADSGVRQNLALVVGLQGRYQEAENIARQELSPAQADANIQYLRSMMSQQGSWGALKKQG
ncbi:tetratricopeptide repeat protein [Rhizobium sp. L1K21]|uniref:tetratricopeptide repeat protein n=1 Tax=Rhizobium sp. L1K21 TaxID=2954933 RepID=UPI002092F135|nr:tetratricopeptide repeat protein [Rhizobium sp. L1K21]MCO6187260.1 tetratricopeptide repeat protein [Rhizobium sp. L1K21]